jgi:hypothetical protein
MFQKAKIQNSFLRLAIYGPSGSGKTYTSLSIATGLGGSIAFIDSEHGSSRKYADRFDFDIETMQSKQIQDYTQSLVEAAKIGYNNIIIDSLSHAWAELLEEVDKLAASKYKGNTWSAWSEGTPKQNKFIEAILNYPGNVIVTMRSKTEWNTTKDGNGRLKPIRVGLAPEQGKGIEYEFDLLLELSPNHAAEVIKDRTGKYQDQIIEKPGKEFGKALAKWLGYAPKPKSALIQIFDELELTNEMRSKVKDVLKKDAETEGHKTLRSYYESLHDAGKLKEQIEQHLIYLEQSDIISQESEQPEQSLEDVVKDATKEHMRNSE